METDINCLFFSAVDDEDSSNGQESDVNEDSGDVGRILTPYEIMGAVGRLTSEPRFTVGFLGYPNVGKSSTINRFLNNKKLQVRASFWAVWALDGSNSNSQTTLLGVPSCVRFCQQ